MLDLIEHYHKLDSIMRCNCLPRLRENTVKSHSAGVGFAGLLIAIYESKKRKCPINYLDVLMKALLHDIEEVFTGDVPYPFKRVKGVRETLKKAVKGQVKTLLKDYEPLFKAWEGAKSDDITGKIVAYADVLDLAMYCLQEIELGNRHMIPVLKEALRVAETYNLYFDKSIEMTRFKSRVNEVINNTPQVKGRPAETYIGVEDFERGIK